MTAKSEFRYFILFKPYGILCQFTPDHPGQQTLADLYQFPREVYSVGRLDMDSEGLLILTDDSALNTKILAPDSKMPKTYWAQVEGTPEDKTFKPLRQGMTVRIRQKKVKLEPAQARILEEAPILPERDSAIRVRHSVPDTWVEVIVTEGKNRQVRRMLANLGHPVLRLIRVGIGHLNIGDLKPGEVKEMTGEEINKILFPEG
jgi:23S rRNA pseudouridine2457 synthase